MSDWYLEVEPGKRSGPATTDLVIEAINAGRVPAKTLVCPKGETAWRPISTVPEFADAIGRERGTAPTGPISAPARPPAVSNGSLPKYSPAQATRGKPPFAGRLATIALGLLGLAVIMLGLLSYRAVRGNIHDPTDVSKEMLPVLLDEAAINRAVRCDHLLGQLKEFQTGKPYVVRPIAGSATQACKAVSMGQPTSVSHGGFLLDSNEDCTKLQDDLPKDLARHENNLTVKTKLFCSAEGKPTTEPDDAAQLAAQIDLKDNLARVVKNVNSGTVSARISACYTDVKKELVQSSERIRKARCEILTKDTKLPNVTYAALMDHAYLNERFEEYKKENETIHDQMSKQDKDSDFYDMFIESERTKSCQTESESPLDAQQAAAGIAVATCM
jgi:hypothetical protein